MGHIHHSSLNASDVGIVSYRQEAALWNSRAIRDYLAECRTYTAELHFSGKVYFDLSQGAIDLIVGAGNQIANLHFHGPAELVGINAASATTPLFRVQCYSVAFPSIVLQDLRIQTDGSGIALMQPGTLTQLKRVHIFGCAGRGVLDYEGWSDIEPAIRSGYGISITDSDGFTCENVSIYKCAGHGLISTRWHAGSFVGRIGQCQGSGFKVQQCNGTHLVARAEGNWGWGLHVRDTGIDRYVDGQVRFVANDGGPNVWDQCWFEANGAVGNANGSGYNYPQWKLDNCADIELAGHLGPGVMDDGSQSLCHIHEGKNILSSKLPEPVRSIEKNSDKITLPHQTTSRLVHNWNDVWPDQRYRPVVSWGTGVLKITLPAHCLDKTAGPSVAYWRPWGLNGVKSPGTFGYRIEIADADGEYGRWARARIAKGQVNCAGTICMAPIGGRISSFDLHDSPRADIFGAIRIDQADKECGPDVNVYCKGMEKGAGVGQEKEHSLVISDLRLWRIE